MPKEQSHHHPHQNSSSSGTNSGTNNPLSSNHPYSVNQPNYLPNPLLGGKKDINYYTRLLNQQASNNNNGSSPFSILSGSSSSSSFNNVSPSTTTTTNNSMNIPAAMDSLSQYLEQLQSNLQQPPSSKPSATQPSNFNMDLTSSLGSISNLAFQYQQRKLQHQTSQPPPNSNETINGLVELIKANQSKISPSNSSSSLSSGGTSTSPHNQQKNNYTTMMDSSESIEHFDDTSSTTGESHMENIGEDASFHPIACVQCRRLHKRCDRKLPCCTKCTSRGVTCEYKIPRKKGRTAKQKGDVEGDKERKKRSTPTLSTSGSTNHLSDPSISLVSDTNKSSERGIEPPFNFSIFDAARPAGSEVYVPQPLHSSTAKFLATLVNTDNSPYGNSTRNQPQKHLDKRKVLDLFYNVFNSETPIIERKEFENYLASKSNNTKEDDIDEVTNDNDVMPNKKEVFALFLALKAICEQRSGMPDLAEESMKRARDAISKIFDEHSNFYVACTYAFMSIYESGCGRVKTARYYLQSVNFYFDEMSEEEQNSLTVFQKNLKRIKGFAVVCSGNDTHLSSLLKDWPNLFEKALGIQLPSEWKAIISQDIGITNYLPILKIIDAMYHMLRLYIAKSRAEKNVKIFDMAAPIVMGGMRIAILNTVNRGKDIIEESALRITLCTENELFIFVPPPIVAHVAAAAKVHLHIVRSIEKGERENPEVTMVPSITYGKESTLSTVDYYEILAKDLRALNILSKRYKKVALFHKAMMQEMEDIIHRKHLMKALTMFSKHSLNEDMPQTDTESGIFSLPSSEQNKSTPESHTTPPPSFEFLNELRNLQNSKEFFEAISRVNQQPQQDTITNSDMSFSDLLGAESPNVNLQQSYLDQEPSPFFEPFFNNEEMNELYSFNYGEPQNEFETTNSNSFF